MIHYPKVAQSQSDDLNPILDQPGFASSFNSAMAHRYNRSPGQAANYYQPQPSTSKGRPKEASRLDDLIRAHDNFDLNHPLPSKFSMSKLEQRVSPSYPHYRSAPPYPLVKPDQHKTDLQLSQERNLTSMDTNCKSFNPAKATAFDEIMMSFENPKVDPSLDSFTPIPSPLIPNTDTSDLEMDSIGFENPVEDQDQNDYQIDTIVQTYLITLGQSSSVSHFADVLRGEGNDAHSTIHSLVKQFSKFSSLQR